MNLNRFFYNIAGIARMLTPSVLLPLNREKILRKLDKYDLDYITQRVDYYCPLNAKIVLEADAKTLDFLRWTHRQTVYFFDCYKYTRYFPQDLRAYFEFGDVYYVPLKPSFTKSRPIQSYYESAAFSIDKSKDFRLDSKPPFANATLLNMDKIRHFIFINDTLDFCQKQDKLFYRGGIYHQNRVLFFQKYFESRFCDLGHTGSFALHMTWQKPKVSIAKHLPYKFLLSLEGNDVASNLKWIMSSNSLTIAPKMKFETWFMEGLLRGGEHFVEIADDYSDVEEKLEYFIAHTAEAKDIIANAHKFVAQFLNKELEDIIALLTIEKYLYYTGQLDALRI